MHFLCDNISLSDVHSSVSTLHLATVGWTLMKFGIG